jgi:hypothetical protein
MDAITRRFRQGGLKPGIYTVRASSAQSGRGSLAVAVREGDVTRAIVALDGKPVAGTTSLQISVAGATARHLQVVITGTVSGQRVRSERLALTNDVLQISKLVLGRYHIDLIDDSGARSCYDIDASDAGILKHLGVINVVLAPVSGGGVNPPDPGDPFFGLSPAYGGLV